MTSKNGKSKFPIVGVENKELFSLLISAVDILKKKKSKYVLWINFNINENYEVKIMMYSLVQKDSPPS